jgi:hypothetical protein
VSGSWVCIGVEGACITVGSNRLEDGKKADNNEAATCCCSGCGAADGEADDIVVPTLLCALNADNTADVPEERGAGAASTYLRMDSI